MNELTMYVREGFDIEWAVTGPGAEPDEWVGVKPHKGGRAILIRDVPLPDTPKSGLFNAFPLEAREFTLSCTFYSNSILYGYSEGIALYIGQLGVNWEVYLNGFMIKKEMAIGKEGQVTRERSLRGMSVVIDKRFLHSDKPNILTFRIVGDPSGDRTGIVSPGPNRIDRKNAVDALNVEYVDMMLMGIYLFFGLYHVVLFLMRPKNRAYMSYGLATMALAIFLFAKTFVIYTLVYDTFWIQLVERVALALLLPAFVLFFDRISCGKVRLFSKIYMAFGCLCALVVCFVYRELVSTILYVSMVLPFGYIFVFDLVIPLVKTFSASMRASEGQPTSARFGKALMAAFVRSDPGKLFWGVVLIALADSLDMIFSSGDSVRGFSKYGFLFLVFGAASILGGQFIRVHKEVETLNADLEEKVHRRTSELHDAMGKQTMLNGELTEINGRLTNYIDVGRKDMAMAIQVQQGLFQKNPPELGDWDIALEFRPAAGVSGDFYDFYSDKGAFRGLVVGDVSGHGIASALITVLAKSVIFRKFSAPGRQSLGKIVESANHELIRELQAVDNYLTAALLRVAGDKVEYVNAAHTEVFFRATGKARAAILRPKANEDYKGFPMGCEGIDMPYQSMKFAVGDGDSLLLYTDCLNEARDSAGLEFGMEGIQSAFARAPEGSARQMLDFVMHEWRLHVGGAPIADDLTVVLLRKRDRAGG